MDPRVKPAGDDRNLRALRELPMPPTQSEPTVASVFTPRTTIDAEGTVEGYASLFGEINQARDVVIPGAFADTLATRDVRRIPMLFQHDPSEPVGIWAGTPGGSSGPVRARPAHSGGGARARIDFAVARGRNRRAIHRLPYIEGAH